MNTDRIWNGQKLVVLVALIWAGMVIGVSGLATPVKFQAPSLTLPVALEVGRATFRLFNKIEWGLAVALVLFGFVTRASLFQWVSITIVVGIVALQTAWLLPTLDLRVATIIVGNVPPASSHHFLYVTAEVLKLFALVAIGLVNIRQ